MVVHDFFSVAEAFVKLGQKNHKGCFVVFNHRECVHIFIDSGIVLSALSPQKQGEEALHQALHLPEAQYAWIEDAEPWLSNLKLRISRISIEHSIARDVHHNKPNSSTKSTTTLPAISQHEVKAEPQPQEKQEKQEKQPAKEQKVPMVTRRNYYLVSENKHNLKLTLVKSTNVVGRDDSADLMIDDPNISRKHCLLQITDRGILVKDLDSTNGTFVNGIRIHDGYINPGIQISLGGHVLTLLREQ